MPHSFQQFWFNLTTLNISVVKNFQKSNSPWKSSRVVLGKLHIFSMSRAFEKNSDLLFAPLGCRWMPANITKNTHTSRPHALSPNALYAVATFAASALRHYVNERTHIEHREEKEYLRRRLWFTCGGEQLHWAMGAIALAFPYSTRATARTMHNNHKVHAHRPKSARQTRENLHDRVHNGIV
jgi:hypothetical protein